MGFFDHLLRDIRSVIDRDGGQNAIPPLDGGRVLTGLLPGPLAWRFAGLERDQAEAACKTLKRAEISCITVRN